MSEYNNSKEITIKDFIILVKSYFSFILKKWWIVLLVTALCVGVALYKHFTHVIKYPYELKFMVETESNQPSFGGLLGQFGFGQQSVSPVKIQEVGRSNLNFEKTVFSKLNDEFIANKIITLYELDKEWADIDANFKDFKFKNDSIGSNLTDKIAFKKLANLTWQGIGNDNKPLMSIDYSFDYGIYTIRAKTINADLSKSLTNTLYTNIVDFFENKILENKTKAVALLQSKVDSLDNVREAKNLEIARFDDRSKSVVSNIYKSKRNILQQDLIAISNSYAEVVKNKEIAEFNLYNNKALFLTIDKTLEPVSGEKSDLVFKLIMAIIAGLLLSILGIIISKFYNTVMNN